MRAMRTALSELAKSERRADKRHRSGVKDRRRADGEGLGRGGGGGHGDDD